MRSILIIIFISLAGSLSGVNAQNISSGQKYQILMRHNYYRTIVGTDSLTWSETLAKEAQTIAKSIAAGDYNGQNQYGINKFIVADTSELFKVVDQWAKEQTFYFGQALTPDNLYFFQHYTQIIWNQTKQIGCAIAQTPAGNYIFVCLYSPKGNIPGSTPLE